MKKFISTAASIVLVAATSVGAMAAPPMTLAPTSNGPRDGNPARQQQFVMNWCSRHPSDPSCNDFRSHRSRWTNNDYGNWYQSHRNTNGFDPLAAGIFGFVAGALAAGAAASGSNMSSHVAACESRYRSYDARSDTYLGYDGVRHRCTL